MKSMILHLHYFIPTRAPFCEIFGQTRRSNLIEIGNHLLHLLHISDKATFSTKTGKKRVKTAFGGGADDQKGVIEETAVVKALKRGFCPNCTTY
jgi:hypothetical protein